MSLVAKTLTCLTVASLEFLQDAVDADRVVEDAIGQAMLREYESIAGRVRIAAS